jgi:hypothetical protein
LEAESRGEATEVDRRRLDELKLTLDQCWDLLRQRRALEEFGLDADAARARPPRWSSATSSSAQLMRRHTKATKSAQTVAHRSSRASSEGLREGDAIEDG